MLFYNYKLKYMKDSKLLVRGLVHSFGVLLYIILLTIFFSQANSWLGQTDHKILSPLLAMLLFVFSALLTGGLVLGKPIMLYLDGQKKEALKLLLFTGGGLFAFMIITFLTLLLLNN